MDLTQLCDSLRDAAPALERNDGTAHWPQAQLAMCAEADVLRWFLPRAYGGWEWSERRQLEGYLAISQACLTTAFVITQWQAAAKRIALGTSEAARAQWLPAMARGDAWATVGISHLTTSRQHVRAPVLAARRLASGEYVLSGFSPWVTGAAQADVLVVGATLADHNQILCAVPGDRPGIAAGAGTRLVALSASCTDQVRFDDVTVQPDEIIAGPSPNVMQTGVGGGAGGLQTSTLAIGLTASAVGFLQAEARQRPELADVAHKLAADAEELRAALLDLADGNQPITPAKLRERANSLVLRSTQAALVAAKGAGFVADHPAGRWCREALFFFSLELPAAGVGGEPLRICASLVRRQQRRSGLAGVVPP
jgi:alkylation response protein AidB-like acyl-CoA dehydrogenase